MRIGELTRQQVVTADLAETLSQAASAMRYADVADPRTHTVAAFTSLGPFEAALMKIRTMSWLACWTAASAICRSWMRTSWLGSSRFVISCCSRRFAP
jgi:hypothetical protein